MRKFTFFLATAAVWGQTQIDLQRQSRHVDFKSAVSTGPVKAGTSVPAVCSIADLFFQTNAAAGANLLGCTASNIWTVLSGGSGGGSGNLTVNTDGALVGSRGTMNFVAGSGILNAISDSGSQINVQHLADTAVLLTQARDQAGAATLCASASGSSSVYTCAMSPTLTAYTAGMIVHWKPDVNGAGGSTSLNVDTLGGIAIRQFDGVTDPVNADILAGRLYNLWYDGSVFRLMVPPVNVLAAGTQPTCNVSQRGRIWQTTGATGVKDSVTVCAKDAADAYAWRTIY